MHPQKNTTQIYCKNVEKCKNKRNFQTVFIPLLEAIHRTVYKYKQESLLQNVRKLTLIEPSDQKVGHNLTLSQPLFSTKKRQRQEGSMNINVSYIKTG